MSNLSERTLNINRYWLLYIENLGTEVDVNKDWETIRDNIKMCAKEGLGYYELKRNNSWFDEGCSKL
jgi:hypothetical protein